MRIELLDCTLRDGAYITNGDFGDSVIKGIIKKLQEANVEIIECGWLKNSEYKEGSSYFHIPNDLKKYIGDNANDKTYTAMIDWDRYDLDNLPVYNGESLNAIRVVFPHGKHEQGIAVAEKISKKGYKVYLQAANTLAYSNEDLFELAKCVNKLKPVGLSVVDTFGAMFEEDIDRIVNILDAYLDKEIMLGFHTHNNQQLAFSNICHFIQIMKDRRDIIVDSSLCGMGRGAGNATTELVCNYLNRKMHKNYDMDSILDAIDTYMPYFQEKYTWGYSTPYFLAGMYQCHVNNIAYLQKNHRTNSKDMRNILDSMSVEDRRKYDYDLLESKYLENQNRKVDDDASILFLKEYFLDSKVLLIAPGKTTVEEKKKIEEFINKNNPKVVFVNALNTNYEGDFLFLINSTRYDYAQTAYPDSFAGIKKILLSNIKTTGLKDEFIINFNRVIKRGWVYFDNAVLCCLRLLEKLDIKNVYLAGFDGFKQRYNESYADQALPTLNPDGNWDFLNSEIQDMFNDFLITNNGKMKISFITYSMFNKNNG